MSSIKSQALNLLSEARLYWDEQVLLIDNEKIKCDRFKRVAYLLACKASKSSDAVTLLSTNKFGEDAAIIARSLFEVLVTIKYISQKYSSLRAKWYEEYNALDYYIKLCNEYKNNNNQEYLKVIQRYNKKDIGRIESSRKNRENREKDLHKYHFKKSSWSFLNLKGMAVQSGLTDYYNSIYWQTSRITHANFDSLYGHLRISRRDLKSENWVLESVLFSCDVYIQILEEASVGLEFLDKSRLDRFKLKLNALAIAASNEGGDGGS